MPSPNVSQRERRRDFFDQDSTRLEFGDRKYIDVFSSTCFNPRALAMLGFPSAMHAGISIYTKVFTLPPFLK